MVISDINLPPSHNTNLGKKGRVAVSPADPPHFCDSVNRRGGTGAALWNTLLTVYGERNKGAIKCHTAK